MPEKYGAYPMPGGNNTEIAGPHRRSPRNSPHISRAPPIGKYLWVNPSDLYNMLDMGKGRGWGGGGGVELQVLQLKGTPMK